ncbi:MAG: guanylate kinase [Desulfohalobiaceae bacterium]|nr:guanylate kinase [Desulfohalobiaceae bacterium]
MSDLAPGLALVISAPSGAGKSTLVHRLLQAFPEFSFSVSCTTREPRPGEQDGREYHFLSRQRFQELREQGYFAEWAEVHGNLYGTPLESVEAILSRGGHIVFDIDVQGARQLRSTLNSGVFVFIFPPSLEELENRLHGRGSDAGGDISHRLEVARKELGEAPGFDYWIVNDDLDRAFDDLRCVYKAETCRSGRNPELYERLVQSAIY